jgi:hypothetical protein
MKNKMQTIRKIDKKNLVKYITVVSAIAFTSETALAATFDLVEFGKALFEPPKKFVLDYYPVAIFLTGVGGMFMAREGDLGQKAWGFGKGAVGAGLLIGAAKLGLGV